jgi:hypothetical protein
MKPDVEKVPARSALDLRIVWSLRSIGRRENRRPPESRRLTDPQLTKWLAFSGPARRLHAGDFIRLLLDNDAVSSPFALQLSQPLPQDEAERHIAAALEPGPWASPSTATYLESLALAFGRPELGQRRAKFGPIRSEQRILEFPSTAGRVVASVAEPGEPLETFVTYVISDDDDAFIVGRVMAEFERRGVPAVVRISDLERGDASAVVTPFTKAATLVNGEPLAKLFPPGAIDDRLVVL